MSIRNIAARLTLVVAGAGAMGCAFAPTAAASPIADCFVAGGVGICVPGPWPSMVSYDAPVFAAAPDPAPPAEPIATG